MKEQKLSGKKVAFLVADGFEQVEFTKPWRAIQEAGGTAVLVSPKDGDTVQGCEKMEKGDTFPIDIAVQDAIESDYHALIIPGGLHNPDTLRSCDCSVQFVKDFVAAGKPIAAICHGPWVLIETGVVKGLHLTSFPSIRTDIENAGGQWTDEEVVCDAGIVTSRKPDDIPAFIKKTIEEIHEGKHERTLADAP